jgi:hypothetical protein
MFQKEKLFLSTIKLMRENNLYTLDNIKFTRKANNIWNQISLLNFGYENYNNSFKIYQWWKRNSNNFSSEIKNFFKNARSNIEKMEIDQIEVDQNTFNKCVHEILDQNDIKEIKGYIGNYMRPKFKSEFDNFLSQKLQLRGIKCWLKCKYNWFLKPNSRDLPYWRGVFVCINHPECLNRFDATISKNFNILKQENSIKILYNETTKHDDFLSNSIRCYGANRDKQKIEILANGLTNCQTNNVIYNEMNLNNERKVTNQNTLKKMKSEFVNRHKMSSDVFVDVLAAKSVTDGMCLKSSSNIEGYIQEISLNPFGFLLFSDIQVLQ